MMLRRFTLALTLLFCTLTFTALARAADAPPAPDSALADFQQGVRVKTLDNGLVLITKENHAAPVTSAYVAVHAGGLFEGPYLGAGISHLTEHLLAEESTTHRSEQEVRKLYEQIGAQSNASTDAHETLYFINTTPDHVSTAIDLLADAMINSAITPVEFTREFGVVQREILNGESDPRRQLAYLLDAALFPYLPQGLRVIGYYENIQKLTRDDVISYYKQMYVPSNMVMCVAGDFDGAKVLAQMEAAFKVPDQDGRPRQWQAPHAPAVVLPEPTPLLENLVAVKEMDTRQANVALAWHGVQIADPDMYALDLLADVLGGGPSSRLAADLRLKRHLVYQIGASNQTPTYPAGVFAVFWACDPDQIDAVRQAVLDHVAALARQAPSVAELDKVKKQSVARLVLETRTASAQARALASNQLQLGDPFFTARYVDHLQKVQPADLVRVAQKYLANTHYLTAIVRPKSAAVAALNPSPSGEGGPPGPGEGLKPTSATSPKAATTENLNLKPSTARIVLDNGLTLLVYRTPGQPAVSLTAVMKAGQTFETADNSGISSMAASYLTRGTATRSEEQIAQFFDSIGGSLGASSGWNSIFLRSLVLKADFPAALQVFADVLQHPAFKPDLLPAVQEDQKAALGANLTDAVGNCSLFFAQQFFPDSPYRFPPTGSAAAIKKLTADAVRDFYKRFAVAKNMVITVAGDVEPAQAEALVKAEFANLPPGDKIEPPARPTLPEVIDDITNFPHGKQIFLQKVDKPSAVIMVGYPGLDLYNLRDRFPMEIFQTIIGSPSLPRSLHNVLRGQSLVYMVFFNGRPGLLPGFHRTVALCQPENATLVARLMIDMVQAGHDLNFSDDDLRDTRSLLLTARQLARQTPEEVALEMALDELYGLGYDFEDKYPERLAAVTAADVKRVVNAYLNNPLICISTPAPDQVDQAELRRPYDAAKLKDMMDKTPKDLPLNKPSDLPAK